MIQWWKICLLPALCQNSQTNNVVLFQVQFFINHKENFGINWLKLITKAISLYKLWRWLNVIKLPASAVQLRKCKCSHYLHRENVKSTFCLNQQVNIRLRLLAWSGEKSIQEHWVLSKPMFIGLYPWDCGRNEK